MGTTRGSCAHDGSPTGGLVDCDLGSFGTGPAAVATITIDGYVDTAFTIGINNTAAVDPQNFVEEFV